jgi:hypothetical protein
MSRSGACTRAERMRLASPLLKHVVYPGLSLSRSGYLQRLANAAPMRMDLYPAA